MYNDPYSSSQPHSSASEHNTMSYGEEAWLKMIRSTHPSRRCSNLAPGFEVFLFRDNLYGLLNTYSENFTWMWLLIGPEKAILMSSVDSSESAKRLCDELTGGLPLVSASAHGRDAVPYPCSYELGNGYKIESIRLTDLENEHILYLDRQNRVLFSVDDEFRNVMNDIRCFTSDQRAAILPPLLPYVNDFDRIFSSFGIQDCSSSILSDLSHTI